MRVDLGIALHTTKRNRLSFNKFKNNIDVDRRLNDLVFSCARCVKTERLLLRSVLLGGDPANLVKSKIN